MGQANRNLIEQGYAVIPGSVGCSKHRGSLSHNTGKHECDVSMFRNTIAQLWITVHVATRLQAASTGVQADSLICKNGITQLHLPPAD